MNGPKILIVEDSKFFLKAIASSFEQQGFQVVTAGTGEEALKQAQATQPDLILLDMMLPRLDGMMVLRMLRGIPALSSTPVIVLSGNSSAHDQTQAQNLGIAGYFLKDSTPVTQLIAQVRKTLKEKTVRS